MVASGTPLQPAKHRVIYIPTLASLIQKPRLVLLETGDPWLKQISRMKSLLGYAVSGLSDSDSYFQGAGAVSYLVL